MPAKGAGSAKAAGRESSPSSLKRKWRSRRGSSIRRFWLPRHARRARRSLTQGLRLFVGQRVARTAVLDGLGVDTRFRPAVQAADHDAVVMLVQQGDREALIPTGFLERV